MTSTLDHLTDEQIGDAERELANRKREREHAKWDAELVGRHFRVIRPKENGSDSWLVSLSKLSSDDYVTLEESLAVGNGEQERYVYADVIYIHIQSREDNTLTCSGFQVSHGDRKEPYLKIQPVFYSYSDFRNYLNTWGPRSGPARHCDEISKDEYVTALATAVASFTKPVSTTKAEGR